MFIYLRMSESPDANSFRPTLLYSTCQFSPIHATEHLGKQERHEYIIHVIAAAIYRWPRIAARAPRLCKARK